MGRFPYEDATVLDQDFLDECYANGTTRLRIIADIETPSGTARVSDQDFYVGQNYYRARTSFPQIDRKLSDWLSPVPEFSTLELEVSNADGEYTSILPGGASYSSWVGNTVEVKIGLNEVESSYLTIYKGKVTDLGGVNRKKDRFVLTTRDITADLDIQLPKKRFSSTTYTNLDDDLIGVTMPIFYGDWTNNLPTFPIDTNGTKGTGNIGVKGFPVNGVAAAASAATNVQVIFTTEQSLTFSLGSDVYLNRGGTLYTINSADITGASANGFSVIQNSGSTTIGGANYLFQKGDTFFAKCSVGSDNPVLQAKALMEDFIGISSSDFDSNWSIFATRVDPAGSNPEKAASRVAIYEQESALTYVQSLLAQVQMQLFVDLSGKFKIHSNMFQDMVEGSATWIKNIDVVKDSLSVKLKDQNNFNRANASFAQHPFLNKQLFLTAVFKNNAAITASGIEISQTVLFPNLYKRAEVEYHLKEILKLASAVFEEVDVELTWRHVLRELGDSATLQAKVSQIDLQNIPAVFRSISYVSEGFVIPTKMWSLGLVPFPDWSGQAGSIGGYDATIAEEV
jgi:hypothetical protein